ncbi:MAG TPA: flavodoxin family protein [Dehalococcoidales bacterium]|nr:flavodoxin family protein [Dehalococcoidales bacterium]
MKVLGIMGSPRIKGNADLLLDEALKGAQSRGADVEKILADRMKIAPCKEYYGCLKDGKCVIRDEMDNVYPKILAADAIIIATPVFFYTVSAPTLTLFSRCQALWARKYVLKNLDIPVKKGAVIAVGATNGEKLFDGLKLTIRYFFKAVNAEYTDELLVRGVDKKGEINQFPELLNAAGELGKRLVS